jgi:hypothetical protein
MKAQKVFELIKRHHPSMPGQEVVDVINDGVDELCRRTSIYEQSYSQDTVKAQRYYTLDAKIHKIIKVTFNEVLIPRLQGQVMIDDDEIVESSSDTTHAITSISTTSNNRFWYEDLGRLGLVEKVSGAMSRAGKTSDYQSVNAVGLLRIKTYSSPADFTTVSIAVDDVSVLDGAKGDFGKYISDYGIAHGYRSPDNLNLQHAEYFEARFEKGVKEARKLGRSGYASNGRIMPVDF